MTLGAVVLVVSVAPGIARMIAPHDEFSSSSSVYDSHIIYIYKIYHISYDTWNRSCLVPKTDTSIFSLVL